MENRSMKSFKSPAGVFLSLTLIIGAFIITLSAKSVHNAVVKMDEVPVESWERISETGRLVLFQGYLACFNVLFMLAGLYFRSRALLENGIYVSYFLLVTLCLSGYSTLMTMKVSAPATHEYKLAETFSLYNRSIHLKAKIDNFQYKYNCCGVINFYDWNNLKGITDAEERENLTAVPQSCYKDMDLSFEDTKHAYVRTLFKYGCGRIVNKIYSEKSYTIYFSCNILVAAVIVTGYCVMLFRLFLTEKDEKRSHGQECVFQNYPSYNFALE